MKDKLNILRCGDQNFWAYYWVAQEHARYTTHNMSYAKHDEIDLKNQDIVYIHSPDITNYHATILPLEAKKRGIKVIGSYAGNPLFWSPSEKRTYVDADLIMTISPQTYSFAKFHYSELPVIYVPESIDTNFFNVKKFDSTSFKVGWAGGVHKKVKRFFIAEQLDHKIYLKDDWKKQRYTKNQNLTLEEMKEFYKSMNVLVMTSESECQPRVVMEAMATGLPVVSTNVGSMKMLLDEEWIVDVNPTEEVVKQLNEKLTQLKENASLRKKVGERNRKHVCKYFSWKSNRKLWDKMFEDVYNDKTFAIIERSENFLKQFKDKFTSELIDFQPDDLELKPLSKEAIMNRNEILRTFVIRLDNAIPFVYWFAEKTCLDIVNNQKIKEDETSIVLGVRCEKEAYILTNILKKINLNVLNIDLNVIVESNVINVKKMLMNEITVNVSVPVVNYLNRFYGKDCVK